MSVETEMDLIHRYKDAYKRNSGRGCIASYHKGWFMVGTGFAGGKYRRSEFEHMLIALERRVSAPDEEK